jgi:hypothetical protein
LQHEERYALLWDAYQRLVRHEKVTQSTWKWRDRLWSEWLWIGVASAFASLSAESPAHRKQLLLSDEPSCGQFAVADSIGPFWFRAGDDVSSLYMVPQRQFRQCRFVPETIAYLSPDFVITQLNPTSRGIAIWSNLDPISAESTASTTAQQLKKVTDRMGSVLGWKSIVITGGGNSIASGELSDSISWASLPLMLQDVRNEWNAFVGELIHHVF